LGVHEYRECSFRGVVARKVRFEDASLVSCDLTGLDPLGAVFRLSCKQGSGNKIDDLRVSMYLYWILHMFDLTTDMKVRVENAIGSKLSLVKRIFESEQGD
jgi:hypothetical protein